MPQILLSHRQNLYGFMFSAFISLFFSPFVLAAETEQQEQVTAPKAAKFLGLTVSEMDKQTVRLQLWQLGGFKVSRSTLNQHHIDKFFTQSRLEDSYSVTFHYNDLGQVTHFRRLYRPYSIKGDNSGRLLSTRQIALQLSKQLGAPRVQRKGWGGFRSYLSYSWQDDEVQISVDRLGEHPLGDVFVEYRIESHTPFAVQNDLDPASIPGFINNPA